MKFKISLHLMMGPKTGVCNDYRLSWRIPKDPSLEAAIITFEDKDFTLNSGEMTEAILSPLDVGFWTHLKVGDSITAFEGYKKVAEADILELLS